MNAILIGYRGSGKTTVGRKLADRLWRNFIDLDDVIVRHAAKSIKDIFAQDGEDHFRDLETQALAEVIKREDHVFSLGGGAVIREQNRQLLKDSGVRVFYLRCDPEELLRRLQADDRSPDMRPNLTNLGGGLAEIRHVLAEREPIYRQVMHAELDVTRMSPDDAVVYIARML
jgi:shikimate kinase